MGALAKIHASSSYRLAVLWLFYFPLVCALLSVIWAGPVALAEGVAFEQAYYWQLQTLTTSSLPLTAWSGPAGAGGIVITNMLAVLHQLILAVFVGLSAGPMIEPMLGRHAGSCGDKEGTLMVARTFKGFLLKLVVLYVTIALYAVLVSILLGGLLSLAEGWAFEDGFVQTLGAITSSGTTMPNTPVLETTAGWWAGFYVGIVAAAFLGLIIAVASVPLLGIDLSYDASPVVLAAPMLFLSAEQRTRLGIPDGCWARKSDVTFARGKTSPSAKDLDKL